MRHLQKGSEGSDTNKMTITAHGDKNAGGEHHEYTVNTESGDIVASIRFQNGPVREKGINGCQNEALIAILIDRLQCFQDGPFASDHNATALGRLESALEALEERTLDRISRGVEGRSQA